jgi:hypothetical protein
MAMFDPLAQHQACAAAAPRTRPQSASSWPASPRPDTALDITSETVVVYAKLSPFERTFLRQNRLFPLHTAAQAADLIEGSPDGHHP